MQHALYRCQMSQVLFNLHHCIHWKQHFGNKECLEMIAIVGFFNNILSRYDVTMLFNHTVGIDW